MGSNEVNLYVVFNNMGSLQYMSHIPCLISSQTLLEGVENIFPSQWGCVISVHVKKVLVFCSYYVL